MPAPARRYPFPFGCIFASRQILCSARCVPDSSARETNVKRPCEIRRNASRGSVRPRICAGSVAGPTITKSLYITFRRATPKPSATNFSSSLLLWLRITSTSPLRPNFKTWPVPPKVTRTLSPDAFSNAGMSQASKPESSVVVVVPSLRTSAIAPWPTTKIAANKHRVRRKFMGFIVSDCYILRNITLCNGFGLFLYKLTRPQTNSHAPFHTYRARSQAGRGVWRHVNRVRNTLVMLTWARN